MPRATYANPYRPRAYASRAAWRRYRQAQAAALLARLPLALAWAGVGLVGVAAGAPALLVAVLVGAAVAHALLV